MNLFRSLKFPKLINTFNWSLGFGFVAFVSTCQSPCFVLFFRARCLPFCIQHHHYPTAAGEGYAVVEVCAGWFSIVPRLLHCWTRGHKSHQRQCKKILARVSLLITTKDREKMRHVKLIVCLFSIRKFLYTVKFD